MGQTSSASLSLHPHIRKLSVNPRCISNFARNLHCPVPVRRRFRLDQLGHSSVEPGSSDSLRLKESLCGVVWRWLDQRFSLRVRALPSRGSTEWRKLCLDFSLFLWLDLAHREEGCRGSFSCLCFSRWDETAHVICMGGGQFPQQVQAIVRIVLHHGIRSPVCVRQLLQDAVPGSSFATYGLSNLGNSTVTDVTFREVWCHIKWCSYQTCTS